MTFVPKGQLRELMIQKLTGEVFAASSSTLSAAVARLPQGNSARHNVNRTTSRPLHETARRRSRPGPIPLFMMSILGSQLG